MKKFFLLFFSCLSIAAAVNAQHCVQASINITPVAGSGPGLTPSSENLPCTIVGSAVSDTLYFENYTTVEGFVTVDSLTIDSIGNLPPGLCWVTNKASNTFAGGESGSIYLEGTSVGPPGQYQLTIIVTAYTNIGTLADQNAATVTGLRYYIRASCPSTACPALDTASSGGSYPAFEPYTACTGAPPATITPAGLDSVCTGLLATLTANAGTGYSYKWNTGAITQAISISTPGAYNVTVYNGTDSAVSLPTTVVSVNILPSATVTTSGATTFCQGDSVDLTAAADIFRYEWSNGDNTQTIKVITSGTYTVTVYNSYGCTAISTPEPVTVNQGPADTITQSGTVLTAQSASSYQWYSNDVILTGDTMQTLTLTQNGTYTVVVTGANGCASRASFTATGVGINSIAPNISLILYPNPTEGLFTLEAPGHAGSYYEITDQLGRTVQKSAIAADRTLVDVSTQLSGIYYLSVTNSSQTETIRFVIMK
jgi:hypothetical protein